MGTEAIRLSWVSKSFEKNPVLRYVNLSLLYGEVCTIMGRNGVGKSTLIRILEGSIPPDSGEIFIDDYKVQLHSRRDATALGIHTVHADIELVGGLTAAENVSLAMLAHQVEWRHNRGRVSEEVERLAEGLGIRIDLDKRAETLGHFEKVAVELMRARANGARILALDEPFSPLRGKEKAQLQSILRRFRDEGAALLLTCHDAADVAGLADRAHVLRDGKTAAMFRAPRRAEELSHMLLPLLVPAGAKKPLPPSPREFEDTAHFAVSGLRTKTLTQPVSFKLRKGEILGVSYFGRSGVTSGIGKALFGMAPAQGQCRLRGRAIEIHSPKQAMEHGIGYVQDDDNQLLVDDFSVQSNITLAALRHVFGGRVLNDKTEEVLAAPYAEYLMLAPEELGRQAATLSWGMKKKLSIARWVCFRHNLLLLDEPTKGLDMLSREQTVALLRDVAAAGTPMIVESSQLDDLVALCDRVLVFAAGVPVGELSGGGLSSETILACAMQAGAGGEENTHV